ncbi:MAG: Eco29kI family restriction endonuclease [Candidatus Eremiobacteraeota bacterium]|nr:Eco29kI family restriction endonuclease [Candidatus Eremiobacteraeota bacterium]
MTDGRSAGRSKRDNWKQEATYNPLDKKNLGDSVADALLGKAVQLLPPAENFFGSGIYALYYSGDFPPYKRMSDCNSQGRWVWPIYIGRAEPRGSRKGGSVPEDMSEAVAEGILREDRAASSDRLMERLRKHSKTIAEVENLNVEHFRCRYLCVDDIWIPLGEALILRQFRPLWNTILDGFGNKTPGSGRTGQKLSSWDTVHPGRSFVKKLNLPSGKHALEVLLSKTEQHLSIVPSRVKSLLGTFVEKLPDDFPQ